MSRCRQCSIIIARRGRRAIEADLPILEVSRLAQLESYRKNIYRPAYYIHKWWARRTGAAFRAILLGALLPEGYSPLEFFYQAKTFDDVVILDPFMGGGTTIGEALRLGTRVIGVDVNPVSWFMVKKIKDYKELARCVRAITQSLLEKLEGNYSLSEADRANLAQAAAAMLYTQGRTDFLPSSTTIR